MKLLDSDIEWLEFFFPSLLYKLGIQKIVGELNFGAFYNKTTREMKIELSERDDVIRKSSNFLCDVFEIEIALYSEYISPNGQPNGWPKVYEIGGRHKAIARKYGVKTIDLHFFSGSSLCCLGIKNSPGKNLTIEYFLHNLVIPFFYRLSYVDHFGIEAARIDLWDEYSHGNKGIKEYEDEMLGLAQRNLGRNKPCPCGSGVKYKKCCLEEFQTIARARITSTP